MQVEPCSPTAVPPMAMPTELTSAELHPTCVSQQQERLRHLQVVVALVARSADRYFPFGCPDGKQEPDSTASHYGWA